VTSAQLEIIKMLKHVHQHVYFVTDSKETCRECFTRPLG